MLECDHLSWMLLDMILLGEWRLCTIRDHRSGVQMWFLLLGTRCANRCGFLAWTADVYTLPLTVPHCLFKRNFHSYLSSTDSETMGSAYFDLMLRVYCYQLNEHLYPLFFHLWRLKTLKEEFSVYEMLMKRIPGLTEIKTQVTTIFGHQTGQMLSQNLQLSPVYHRCEIKKRGAPS